MSRVTWATCRLARWPPASKIGSAMPGTKLQAPEPALNRAPRSLLAAPADAVSEMLGKKAARAAPMLAWAACSWRSACSTSGRRCSTCDGTPAGSSLRTCVSSAGAPFGSSSSGTGAPTTSVSALRSCATWLVKLATSARAVSTLVCACARSRPDADAELVAAQGQPVGGLLARQRVLGQPEALLVGGQREVARGDLGDQTDLRGAARLLGGQELLQRLFLQAAHAAEEVEFVGADADAEAVLVRRQRLAGRAHAGRRALCRQRTGRGDRGKRLARWIRYCARACSMLSTATRRSRFSVSASAITRRSRSSAKKACQASSAAAGRAGRLRVPPGQSAATGAAGRW